MDWELPQPTKPRPKKSIPPFGDLKTVVKARLHCQSPFTTQIKAQNALARITLEWRDEQFARAVIKRSGQLAAWEALHWKAHQQCMAHGAAPPA